jgi:hypothetical protein
MKLYFFETIKASLKTYILLLLYLIYFTAPTV